MNRTKLPNLFSGMALTLGLAAGIALSGLSTASAAPVVAAEPLPAQMVDSEAASASVVKICGISCKRCNTNADCGPDEGPCGAWLCP
jgi:hypothetical protein